MLLCNYYGVYLLHGAEAASLTVRQRLLSQTFPKEKIGNKTLPDGAIRINSVALNYQKGNSIGQRGTFKTSRYG